MRVRVLSRVGDPKPLVKEASVVLVEDDAGTIVAVAVSLLEGRAGQEIVHVAHAADADFHSVLRSLGIHAVTICDRHALKGPDELQQAPRLELP